MSNVIHADFRRDSLKVGIKCEVLYCDSAVVLVRNTIKIDDEVLISHHAEEL